MGALRLFLARVPTPQLRAMQAADPTWFACDPAEFQRVKPDWMTVIDAGKEDIRP